MQRKQHGRHPALNAVSCGALGATLAVWVAAPASAADATYATEAAFLAGAGNLAVESFENLAGISRSLAPIVTPGFTISTAGAPIGLQTAADAPDAGYGGAATDGTHWVSVYLPNQPQGSITLTFANPTTAFGVKLVDIGEASGTVVLSTNAGAYAGGVTLLNFPPTLGNGAVSFVGLTQNTAFTRITISVSGIDDAYGLDQVRISAVPEPASALALLAGLAGVAASVRRRRA